MIFAEQRAARPQAFVACQPPPEDLLPCPFCHGQEHRTPPGREYFPARPYEWQVRVVPNLYPAVSAGGRTTQLPATADGPPTNGPCLLPAHGIHEVIIESPDHCRSITELSAAQLTRVCHVYRDRLARLPAQPGMAAALLFKNVGPQAGASLAHLHSQILALATPLPALTRETTHAQRYFAQTGACLFCEMLSAAQRAPDRLVMQGELVTALCPYAPRFAYETWLLPRVHRHAFEHESDAVLSELAAILWKVIHSMETLHPYLSYNYYIHSAPFHVPCHDYYHWHLEVLPRTHHWAGFEMGAGCVVNPVTPETAAQRLRQHLD